MVIKRFIVSSWYAKKDSKTGRNTCFCWFIPDIRK